MKAHKCIIMIICLCSILLSCAQVNESLIEGKNWSRSGNYHGRSWSITKKGDHLSTIIDGLNIQLYPTIKVGDMTLSRCGLSSVGPSSQDFDMELPEHGFFYSEQPYAFSFKLDNSLEIYTLSQESSSQGKLYLQSKISINLFTKEITLEEIVHNSKSQNREVQFGYLVNIGKNSKYLPDFHTIFPLNEDGQKELGQVNSFNPPPSFCGLRKNNYNTYYSYDDLFLKISHPDLPYLSQLDKGMQMISNSYYQPRNLARQMGRIPLMDPYREISFITKITIASSAPKEVNDPTIDNKLESFSDLDIE